MILQQLHNYKIQYFSSLYDELFSAVMPTVKSTYQAPFFIFGSGRNGSTLLSVILNNHEHICIPPEHWIIPTVIKYWYLHPFYSWEKKIIFIIAELTKPSMRNIDLISFKEKLL